MEFKKMHWIGIILGALIIIASIIFAVVNPENQKILFLLIGLGIISGVGPIIFSIILEGSEEKDKEEMFIEFSRDLVESVKAGTPIIKGIVNMRNKPYGTLTQHVKKLANQISLGIPIQKALRTFADDVQNKTVSRAIALIGEAERAGGDIGRILESVALSVTEINKLKKERRSAIYSLVVQGYIIFIVFMAIILVMQFKILPLVEGIANLQTVGFIDSGPATSTSEISKSFFYLLMIQGLFTGLFVGKLAEGTIKAGLKHSFILIVLAFLVYGGAKLFT